MSNFVLDFSLTITPNNLYTMGYYTEFKGSISIVPALTSEQKDYINLLFKTRRMKRDPSLLQTIYGGKHGLL